MIPTIKTYPKGRYINLKDPKPEDIEIEDIAWSLGEEGRYSNFLCQKYSVGEHSLHAVAIGLHPRWEYSGPKRRAQILLRLQLHDAAEAYLRDLPGPLKPLVPDYCALEKKHQSTIYRRFELSANDPEADSIVKCIDKMLGEHERTILRGSSGRLIPDFVLDINESVKIILGDIKAKTYLGCSTAMLYRIVFQHLQEQL